MAEDGGYVGENWLEQTQYIAHCIYEDANECRIPLDLHSACAIGNYECVQDAVNRGVDLNQRNKGKNTVLVFVIHTMYRTFTRTMYLHTCTCVYSIKLELHVECLTNQNQLIRIR